MIQKGMVISLSAGDEIKRFVVADRLDDLGQGEGGWMCVDIDAIIDKGIDSISAMDCWRVTDKYLEVQMKRGVIKIIE